MHKREMRGAPRVMVVEDDRAVIRMLRLALRAGGFDVEEVTDGRAALQALAEQPIDAVILDLGLPDGLAGAVLQRMRDSRPPHDRAPAWVVMSALDRSEATQQYGPMGNRFVAKPFDPWDVVRLLNHQRAQSERE